MHSPVWPRAEGAIGGSSAVACPWKSRQVNLDRRAFTDLAVDLHVAAGLLDEAVHLAEPKAGALARLLGGEEGLERMLHNVVGHADPVVGDGDQNILAGLHVAVPAAIGVVEVGVGGLDRELAALGHCVPRVDRKVHQDGFQLGRIGLDRPQAAAADHLEFDFFAQGALQKVGQPADQPVDVDRGRA